MKQIISDGTGGTISGWVFLVICEFFLNSFVRHAVGKTEEIKKQTNRVRCQSGNKKKRKVFWFGSASGAVETCGPAWSNITDTPRALRNVGAVEKKLVTLTLMVLWSCALSGIFNRESRAIELSRDLSSGRHTEQLPPFPVRVVLCSVWVWNGVGTEKKGEMQEVIGVALCIFIVSACASVFNEVQRSPPSSGLWWNVWGLKIYWKSKASKKWGCVKYSYFPMIF